MCDVSGPHTHNGDARKEFYVDDKYVTINTWCIGDIIVS